MVKSLQNFVAFSEYMNFNVGYGSLSFEERDTKLDRYLANNQHTFRKILNFVNRLGCRKMCRISIFYVKNHLNLFHFLTEYNKFCSKLFVGDNFCFLQFSKHFFI